MPGSNHFVSMRNDSETDARLGRALTADKHGLFFTIEARDWHYSAYFRMKASFCNSRSVTTTTWKQAKGPVDVVGRAD